ECGTDRARVEPRRLLRESTTDLLFRIPRSAFRVPLAREPEARMAPEAGPRAPGRFGPYGGRYVPETLMAALEELERVYETARRRPPCARASASSVSCTWVKRTCGASGSTCTAWS